MVPRLHSRLAVTLEDLVSTKARRADRTVTKRLATSRVDEVHALRRLGRIETGDHVIGDRRGGSRVRLAVARRAQDHVCRLISDALQWRTCKLPWITRWPDTLCRWPWSTMARVLRRTNMCTCSCTACERPRMASGTTGSVLLTAPPIPSNVRYVA